MDKLGKIHRHHRKEHLNLSKIAKFENDMSNVSKYIALKIFFSKIAKFENDMSNASKYIALKIFFLVKLPNLKMICLMRANI